MERPGLSADVLAHRAWLLAFLDPPESGLVVDLACGRGDDLHALASRLPRREARFLGLDASEKSLEAARARAGSDPRLEFRRADLGARLPLGDASVDAACSNNLLECLTDPAAFATEVARVLRPGGRLVVAHWDWDSQQFDGPDRPLVRRLVHAYCEWRQPWMEHSDGWMGRRLWGLFGADGSFDVAVHARVLVNTEYAEPWFGFANARAFRSLVKPGLATPEDLGRVEEEQLRLRRDGRYFYAITATRWSVVASPHPDARSFRGTGGPRIPGAPSPSSRTRDGS
jgi:SAM-dependent methyltransferase